MRKVFFLVFIYAFAIALAFADHPTAGLGSDSTGPIITISATTLDQGDWGFVTRFEYGDFESFSDEELIGFVENDIEGVHSLDSLYSPFFGVAYGVTDNFTVSARIPYVKRTNIREGEIEEHHGEEEEEEHEEEEPEEIVAHMHGDSAGIGDLILFGQYRFVNNFTSNLQAAALFGLKVPTGKDDDLDLEGSPFETEHQPGSGSVDPLFGLAITRRFEKVSVDGNVLYTLTTEGAQDTELGDFLHYNVALSYRLNGEAIHHDSIEDSPHRHNFWDVTIELNGEYQQKHKIAEEEEANTGGSLVYISPGVRFTATNLFSAFFSIGFPIIQDLNGTQHETSFRTLAGVGFGF